MPARLARIGGLGLRGLFALLLAVRGPRPIHPHGLVLRGEAVWLEGRARSGVSWIDEAPPRRVPVVGRLSRSVGLPDRLPDVLGLALRFGCEGGRVDLALSSTGIGFPGRFVLAAHRSPTRATFGSLIPYASPGGPLLLCARAVPRRPLPPDLGGIREAIEREPWRVRLFFATPAGRWHAFAEAVLRPGPEGDDPAVRFDPVAHPVPGAGTYPWVRALRQPSYRLVQRRARPHPGAVGPGPRPGRADAAGHGG